MFKLGSTFTHYMTPDFPSQKKNFFECLVITVNTSCDNRNFQDNIMIVSSHYDIAQ